MALERVVALREGAATRGAGETLRTLLELIGYRGFLQKEYEDDPAEQEARWDCVEQMVNALADHEKSCKTLPTAKRPDFAGMVRGFLDELVLDVTEAERFRSDKPKGNVLRLMTLHAAKGLEFDCVWMVGMEEGLLPHHRSLNDGLQAIDEERRLCYVGVTRAKKRLALSLCLTRMKWGKSKPCKPSRFLYELTGQAEKFTDEPAGGSPTGTHPAASASAAQAGRGGRGPARRGQSKRT
jgi:DNA helicase-2/ATP-dependent DNA helicase PcrA